MFHLHKVLMDPTLWTRKIAWPFVAILLTSACWIRLFLLCSSSSLPNNRAYLKVINYVQKHLCCNWANLYFERKSSLAIFQCVESWARQVATTHEAAFPWGEPARRKWDWLSLVCGALCASTPQPTASLYKFPLYSVQAQFPGFRCKDQTFRMTCQDSWSGVPGFQLSPVMRKCPLRKWQQPVAVSPWAVSNFFRDW